MISVPSAASLIWYSQELQLFLQMMVLEEEVFEIPRKVSEVGFFFVFFFFVCLFVLQYFQQKIFISSLLFGDSGERQVLDKESCSEQV